MAYIDVANIIQVLYYNQVMVVNFVLSKIIKAKNISFMALHLMKNRKKAESE